MPTEKAMMVLELLDAGERNFTKIASSVGLSTERVRQIANKVGIFYISSPKEPESKVCPTCQKIFETKKKISFCSRDCAMDYKFLRPPRIECIYCHAKNDLVKTGKVNFKQQYVCRTCVKKRVKKYGYYQKKDDPKWVEKKRKYYREYHRKRRERIRGNKE